VCKQEADPAIAALKEEEGKEQQDGGTVAASLKGAAAPAFIEVESETLLSTHCNVQTLR